MCTLSFTQASMYACLVLLQFRVSVYEAFFDQFDPLLGDFEVLLRPLGLVVNLIPATKHKSPN